MQIENRPADIERAMPDGIWFGMYEPLDEGVEGERHGLDPKSFDDDFDDPIEHGGPHSVDELLEMYAGLQVEDDESRKRAIKQIAVAVALGYPGHTCWVGLVEPGKLIADIDGPAVRFTIAIGVTETRDGTRAVFLPDPDPVFWEGDDVERYRAAAVKTMTWRRFDHAVHLYWRGRNQA